MGTGASAEGATAHQTKGQATPQKDNAPNLCGDTLVIEVGTDGEAIERGVGIADAQQIFVVIDPRAGRSISDVKFLNDIELLRKVLIGGGGKTLLKIFVLVPSATSSKAHLMNAHIAVMWLGHWSQQNPCFIRTDDYYHNGDSIMRAMVEGDKRVYPAEEAENMHALIEAVAQGMWTKRAYVHAPVARGFQEEDVDVETILDEVGFLFCAEQSLPRVGDAPPDHDIATLAVIAKNHEVKFLVFSEASEASFAERTTSRRDEMWASEGDGMLRVTEDMLADDLGAGLGDLATETACVVLFVGSADLPRSADGPALFVRCITRLRSLKPGLPICVALIDENVEAFKQNLWLVPVLPCLIESANFVIFASTDEVKDVAGFFTKTRYFKSDVASLTMLQLIIYPRLHFYTLGTAIGGAELEDAEIFLPAVTVGPADGNRALPANSKFRLDNNPFIFQGFPNHERVIPGTEDFSGVSLIAPAKLLVSIFSGVCDGLAGRCEGGGLTWKDAFGEDFQGVYKDSELADALADLKVLCTELTQCSECRCSIDRKMGRAITCMDSDDIKNTASEE